MAKVKTRYVCQNCGRAAPRYLGKCPRCGEFGTMVAIDADAIRAVPLKDAISQMKMVDPESDTVRTARDLGVSFGDWRVGRRPFPSLRRLI